jgi:hypothetical protein
MLVMSKWATLFGFYVKDEEKSFRTPTSGKNNEQHLKEVLLLNLKRPLNLNTSKPLSDCK